MVVAVAAAGAIAVWRILSGLIESHTSVHDTRIKVAQLQIKYLTRAQAMRAGEPEESAGEVFEVASPGDSSPANAAPTAAAA